MNYLFCYGSLVNSQSRKQTLNRKSKSIIAYLKKGFVREFNTNAFSKLYNKHYTALGLSKSESNHRINGILICISELELQKLDLREKYYTRILLNKKDFHINNNIKSYPIWAYIQENPQEVTEKYPIESIYLNICNKGFLEYGFTFFKEFIHSIT